MTRPGPGPNHAPVRRELGAEQGVVQGLLRLPAVQGAGRPQVVQDVRPLASSGVADRLGEHSERWSGAKFSAWAWVGLLSSVQSPHLLAAL